MNSAIRVHSRDYTRVPGVCGAATGQLVRSDIAGADCGFSSQALHRAEVHPTVIWEKFKAMRAGADLASKELWH